MSTEKKFADGVLVKKHEFQGGDFLLKVGIKVQDFAKFVKENVNERGWLNLNIRESRGGKWYCELDTYEPKQEQETHQAEVVQEPPPPF